MPNCGHELLDTLEILDAGSAFQTTANINAIRVHYRNGFRYIFRTQSARENQPPRELPRLSGKLPVPGLTGSARHLFIISVEQDRARWISRGSSRIEPAIDS